MPKIGSLSAKDQAIAVSALKQFFSHFESMGGGESGPPFTYVAKELDKGDAFKVDRTFDELVYRYSPTDSLPVLRSYVKDANPYIRYKAAQNLLVAGDDSGVAALMALLRSDTPIEAYKPYDLRLAAALTLAKYHQTAALPDIVDLYSKAHDSNLIQPLANLGVPLPGQEKFPFVAGDNALIEYAQTNDTRFVPQISALFERASKPELKAAAAWSLATMTGDETATNFLVQKARSGLDPANVQDARDERETIKYVGTLQTPEAKPTLEAALDSPDGVVVQTAVVNLLYNQGGSDRAIQKVANRLFDSHNPLPVDFVFEVATKFSDVPVLRAAGERFAQANQGNNEAEWRHNVVERQTWPSANWVGDFMIQVKR